MPVIPTTWETEVRGLQFEAGQENLKTHLKNKAKASTEVWLKWESACPASVRF
jgi:hypothetical protein